MDTKSEMPPTNAQSASSAAEYHEPIDIRAEAQRVRSEGIWQLLSRMHDEEISADQAADILDEYDRFFFNRLKRFVSLILP